jgi:hypothetical protein
MPTLGENCPNCGKMVEHVCLEKDRLINAPFETIQGGKPAVQKYFGDQIRAAILKVLIEYPHESLQSLSKGWELNEVILPQIMAGQDCLINNRLLDHIVDGLQIPYEGLWDMIQAPDDKKTRILADIIHQLNLEEAVERLMQPNPELARAAGLPEKEFDLEEAVERLMQPNPELARAVDLPEVDLPEEEEEFSPPECGRQWINMLGMTLVRSPQENQEPITLVDPVDQETRDRIYQTHSYFLTKIARESDLLKEEEPPLDLATLKAAVVQDFRKIRDRIYQTHSYFLAQISSLPTLDLIKMAEKFKLITPEQAQDLIRETEAIEPGQ